LLSKPFLSKGAQTYYLGLIFRLVSGLVTAANPFWSFTLHGKLPAQRPKKLIVMCNHVSNLDPFVTCRALLPWESKYIAKSGLFKVPFGGWAMSMAGDIPVYFTSEKGGWGLAKGSVGKMMENCKWLVENGCPIMVFPEGARSGSMVPREYKNGMFQFAIDNGCAILPIALNNTHKAWSRKDVLDQADIHLTIGEVIDVNTSDVEALKNQVRTEILRLTASLPNTCHDDEPVAEKAVDGAAPKKEL
jgi:1-acyl-sn-glycerol-3-phosphate acyltransferase